MPDLQHPPSVMYQTRREYSITERQRLEILAREQLEHVRICFMREWKQVKKNEVKQIFTGRVIFLRYCSPKIINWNIQLVHEWNIQPINDAERRNEKEERTEGKAEHDNQATKTRQYPEISTRSKIKT